MSTLRPEIWKKCLERLKEVRSINDYETWICPLHAREKANSLILVAPNQFIVDWVEQNLLKDIKKIIKECQPDKNYRITLEVGFSGSPMDVEERRINYLQNDNGPVNNSVNKKSAYLSYGSQLNPIFQFENFVKGKSNEFAFAAAYQVALKPRSSHNPLLIYGGVGLGKTHLMQAIGNALLENDPKTKVLYLHSERFIANMVKSLQISNMEAFQNFYRSVDVLLIDDIQFLAGKDRTQEEFFHTFNTLLEDKKLIVLTCDRYPKEIEGFTERLRSRFSWGLTIGIEPPELETRVAILMSKAEAMQVSLSSETAFFIAKRIRSNIRELEGALRRVVANADFTGRPITLDFVKETLKDLLSLQDKLVTLENIQKVVAEYYKIKIADLLSHCRSRSVARPRQMAMLLAKELTNHSFPEIGDAFSGKDHTTVLHACRTMRILIESNASLKEDYTNLMRILTT